MAHPSATTKPTKIGIGNMWVGKCPGCAKGTDWLHCGQRACTWLVCEGCGVVWSERVIAKVTRGAAVEREMGWFGE